MVLPLLRGRTMLSVVPRPITSLHFNRPTLSSWVPSPEEISAKGIKVT
jgi:hypothetical protein